MTPERRTDESRDKAERRLAGPERIRFVADLRALSDRLGRMAGSDTTYFPQRECPERMPVPLVNYVPLSDVAGLLHYVADMLEE